MLLIAIPTFAQDPPLGILTEIGVDQNVGGELPMDAMFRDQTGREVRLADLFRQKPVVLVPVYYECPMLCSLVLDGFTSALRVLEFSVGKEFDVITFSIDPKEDPATASAKWRFSLDQYDRDGAQEGWHFLTGDESSIRALTDALGYRYKYDTYTDQWAHPGAIAIATADGRISQYLYGMEFSPRDLRLSLVTASDNKLGTILDRVFLYCYHYDPTVGRYGFAIMNTLRVAGVGTVLALGFFIFTNIRRQ